MSVGMIWRIARPSESTPAMRAPSIGRRIAADQKRMRVWGKGRKPLMRFESRRRSLAEDRSGPGCVEVGGEDQLVRRVGVLAARDDVLRRAAEEEEAQEVAARVEVEVEGRGRERGARAKPATGTWIESTLAATGEKGVERPDERRLRVNVDGLDLGPAAGVAQARGHGVRGAALGVGARQAAARTSRARRSSRAWGRCGSALTRASRRALDPCVVCGRWAPRDYRGSMRRVGIEPTCPFGHGF